MTRLEGVQKRQRAREAGFTLMEALVALAVLGLLMSLLPQALHILRKSSEFQARLQRTQEIDAARQFMEVRIKAAMAVVRREPSGAARVAFSGGERELQFVSSSASGPGGGGTYVYRFALASGAQAKKAGLTLELERYRAARDSRSERWTHTLLPADTSVAYRYFGAPKLGEEPRWHGEWGRRDALPKLVEILIEDRQRGVHHRSLVALRTELR